MMYGSDKFLCNQRNLRAHAYERGCWLARPIGNLKSMFSNGRGSGSVATTMYLADLGDRSVSLDMHLSCVHSDAAINTTR